MPKIRGIYSLCDNSLCTSLSHIELAEKLLQGGVKILQLRMKGERDLHRVRNTVRDLQNLKKKFSYTLIVNDFFEIALDLGADGIHLGRDDLPLAEARRLTPPGVLLGYSSHSLPEAVEAWQQGADYVALGAIYPTATKGPGHPVVGVEVLRQVVERLRVPVVAIGGIQRENFAQVAATGVDAVAMIGALNLAKDVTAETQWFVREWERLHPAP